jgi:hypothetical protein
VAATPSAAKLHGLHKYAHTSAGAGAIEVADKLTPQDLAALTPLIWDHVNPYGRFELDMTDRLPLK